MGIEWLRPAAFFGSIVYALIGVLMTWWLVRGIGGLNRYAQAVSAGEPVPPPRPRWRSPRSRSPPGQEVASAASPSSCCCRSCSPP